MDAQRHQGVEPGAFIDFVEMRQWLAAIEHSLAVAALDGRTLGVVERPFHQIAGGHQILEALLVLDADQIASEIVGDAQRGDVHLALQENLVVGQVLGVVRAGVEGHATLLHPAAHFLGLTVFDLSRLVV